MRPVPGTEMTQDEALRQQKAQATAFLKKNYGRTPIDFDNLLRAINDAEWPTEVELHPLDFFFISGMAGQVHKDNQGPYFYVSSSKIRPAKGSDNLLDLTGWEPEEPPVVQLATFFKE